MSRSWSLISYSKGNGYGHMAIDEALFEGFRAGNQELTGGIIRFYEFFEPTCTIGCFQKMADFPAGTFGKGYDIVRRPTGGGLVDHDESLTFSFITHKDEHPAFATIPEFYKKVHTAIFRAFLECGIRLVMHAAQDGETSSFDECFKKPVQYDLLFNEQKIVGGAQKRSQGFLLHQSSIFLGADEWKERPYLKDLLRNMIVKQFEDSFDIRLDPRCLTPEETHAAMQIEHGKYRTDAWREKH